MSWGGSISCGFDLINSDGSEYIPEYKPKQNRCRACRYFEYHIHHNSICELFPEEGLYKHRDGRAVACEKFKPKKKRVG